MGDSSSIVRLSFDAGTAPAALLAPRRRRCWHRRRGANCEVRCVGRSVGAAPVVMPHAAPLLPGAAPLLTSVGFWLISRRNVTRLLPTVKPSSHMPALRITLRPSLRSCHRDVVRPRAFRADGDSPCRRSGGRPRSLESRAPAFWLVASSGRVPVAARRRTVPSNLHLSLDESVRPWLRSSRSPLLTGCSRANTQLCCLIRSSLRPGVRPAPRPAYRPGGPHTHTVTQVWEL